MEINTRWHCYRTYTYVVIMKNRSKIYINNKKKTRRFVKTLIKKTLLNRIKWILYVFLKKMRGKMWKFFDACRNGDRLHFRCYVSCSGFVSTAVFVVVLLLLLSWLHCCYAGSVSSSSSSRMSSEKWQFSHIFFCVACSKLTSIFQVVYSDDLKIAWFSPS